MRSGRLARVIAFLMMLLFFLVGSSLKKKIKNKLRDDGSIFCAKFWMSAQAQSKSTALSVK